jgi:hypothetical protein
MKCHKAERFLLRSFDKRLDEAEQTDLDRHLHDCRRCRKLCEEYRLIISTLREENIPAQNPYFWQRLKVRIDGEKTHTRGILWKQWAWKAAALTLVLAVLIVGGTSLFLSAPRTSFPGDELSESGTLLLRDNNPFQETYSLFETENVENKNMMLIFTALEEKDEIRRYFP